MTKPSADNPSGQPLGLPLNDQLGAVSRAALHQCRNTAEQCRLFGLKVGDTIEGREEAGAYWHEARLTLLWIGRQVAVWSVAERSNSSTEWSAAEEDGDWTLEFREWRRVGA